MRGWRTYYYVPIVYGGGYVITDSVPTVSYYVACTMIIDLPLSDWGGTPKRAPNHRVKTFSSIVKPLVQGT